VSFQCLERNKENYHHYFTSMEHFPAFRYKEVRGQARNHGIGISCSWAGFFTFFFCFGIVFHRWQSSVGAIIKQRRGCFSFTPLSSNFLDSSTTRKCIMHGEKARLINTKMFFPVKLMVWGEQAGEKFLLGSPRQIATTNRSVHGSSSSYELLYLELQRTTSVIPPPPIRVSSRGHFVLGCPLDYDPCFHSNRVPQQT